MQCLRLQDMVQQRCQTPIYTVKFAKVKCTMMAVTYTCIFVPKVQPACTCRQAICWQVDMHGSQIETERLNGWLGECTSSLPDMSESSLLTKREIWPCNSCVVSSQPTPASCRTTDDASLSCEECLLLGTLIEALPDGFCASSSWVANGTAFAAGRSHFCSGQTYLTSSVNSIFHDYTGCLVHIPVTRLWGMPTFRTTA